MNKNILNSTFVILNCSLAFCALADFKGELKDAQKELGRISVHSSPEFIRERIAVADAFLEKHGADTNFVKDVEKLHSDVLRQCVRGGECTLGLGHVEPLLGSKNPSYRAQAYSYRAKSILGEKHDFAAALAALEPAYADKEIVAKALRTVVDAGTDVLVVKGKLEEALSYVEAKRTAFPGKDDLFDGAAAQVFEAFYRPLDAVHYLLERGNRRRAFGFFFEGRVGGNEKEDALGLKLAKELVLESANVDAWGYLWRVDPDFAEANLERMTFDGDGKLRKGIYNDLVGQPHSSPFRQMLAGNNWQKRNWAYPYPVHHGNYALGARVYRTYLKFLGFVKTEKPRPDMVWGGVRSYLGLGDEAKARETIAFGRSLEKLSPEETYRFTMAEKLLDGIRSGDDRPVAAAHDELSKPIAEKNRRKAFEEVAKAVGADGATAKLEFIAKAYKRFVNVDLPKKVYTVKFSERRIYGPEDWKAVAPLVPESDFDRAYGGGGLSFMTTDVASGDRGNAEEAKEKARKYPTVLQVVCDSWGVHFLSTYFDRRARQFETGELDCGSYENYLAPGADAPYMCIMQSMKSGRTNIMNTMYNAPGHRRVDPKDPALFRSDVFYTDDRVMAYTGFAWENFPERLPENGAEWDYESLFWGPVSSAWNGAQSIHGRSTFGKLRFELADAQRLGIQKRLLFRAAAMYRAEKKPTPNADSGIQSGCLDFWQDVKLGDPAFYDTCLKPLVAELDAAAAKVKTGITDDEVRALSRDYLGRFVNIRYTVSQLRARYVKERL